MIHFIHSFLGHIWSNGICAIQHFTREANRWLRWTFCIFNNITCWCLGSDVCLRSIFTFPTPQTPSVWLLVTVYED